MANDEISHTKIIMLGGRRTGKSTILASVIHALNNKASHLCTFSDKTPYDASTGMSVSLIDKQYEIRNYIHTRAGHSFNTQFTVNFDETQTVVEGDFNIEASIKGAARIGLDFVDVPGEWMRPANPNHKGLVTHVSEGDVFIIAIDTPYMMYEDNSSVGEVWNRSVEITELMNSMKIEDVNDRKQIIFAPIKCEKWAREGRIDEVVSKVLHLYRVLINTWVGQKAVEMWVMPILTAGGLEHTRMLDGYRLFKTEQDEEGEGELCSRDPLTDVLLLQNGGTTTEGKVYKVESDPDRSLYISSTRLPLSWYRVCGDGKYKPRFCEQIAFHILRFLVEKEENAAKLKYEEHRNKPWYKRIFSRGGRFGRYLPIYRDLINRIPLKVSGDGFMRINEYVQDDDEGAAAAESEAVD